MNQRVRDGSLAAIFWVSSAAAGVAAWHSYDAADRVDAGKAETVQATYTEHLDGQLFSALRKQHAESKDDIEAGNAVTLSVSTDDPEIVSGAKEDAARAVDLKSGSYKIAGGALVGAAFVLGVFGGLKMRKAFQSHDDDFVVPSGPEASA